MDDSARVLICTVPVPGHVNPGLPLARALVERGHEVRWYTGRDHRQAVEATGAAFEPIVEAHDPADQPFQDRLPERAALEGLRALEFDLKHVFLDEVPAMVADVERILARFPADVLLVDTAFVAASAIHERGGPPFATYGISVLPIPSRDIAPIGTGRPPAGSALGRLRDRVLSRSLQRLLFRDVQRHHQQVRARIGLAPTRRTVFDLFVSPYLYLHGATASFEYPRRDLPAHVHFVGPLLPEASGPAVCEEPESSPSSPSSPSPSSPDRRRPLVLVTQGTVATDLDELVAPTLRALADDDVTVVATGGAGAAGLRMPIPANAHVHAYVPFEALMPHVDVMVTNGGFGGVQIALAHGVPLVVAGATEDKPEVAARVAWSGVGVRLATRTPAPDQVRSAVRTVLTDPTYRRRAGELQREIAGTDPARTAADLIGQLARTGRPVDRPPAPVPARADGPRPLPAAAGAVPRSGGTHA